MIDMADEIKISELVEKTTVAVDNDEIVIMDSAAPISENPKRTKLKNIISQLPADVARLSLATLQTFQGPLNILKISTNAMQINRSAELGPTNIEQIKFVNRQKDSDNNDLIIYAKRGGIESSTLIDLDA